MNLKKTSEVGSPWDITGAVKYCAQPLKMVVNECIRCRICRRGNWLYHWTSKGGTGRLASRASSSKRGLAVTGSLQPGLKLVWQWASKARLIV